MTTATLQEGKAVEVRKAQLADSPRVARTLGSAFYEDPLFRYAFPDDERRRKVLPGFFSLFLDAQRRYDEVHTTGDGTGAALWVPPGKPGVPDDFAETFGERMEIVAGVDIERVADVSELVDEHHPDGSFYFLHFLGVEPDRQGRGVGSSLLAHVLDRCDREGAYAYLDATSERNRRLYERHGFEATGEYGPPGGPTLWPMWRRPVGQG